ncbi:pyridoxamine 5'-phosphate oxidase family protein [Luteimicrobium subarcticum]|uniref:Pyridoxamine 5'-phosphate oxidase-like protein n=1 Tax=Luteimicrobium subarcticum TaxID=620910 RepID=A0A2M8WTY9_9MICO|nr:pyridoxamine 5'-phosphate oxidase family protein [Luteimicrobium subarcticum]PJI94358.1 hypothetical protein CLV34_0194 [Luteimicrobium subarcticum]
MTGYTTDSVTELDDRQCRELLAARTIARLAVSFHDDIEIYPVNYTAANDAIWIRTAPGTKLATLTVQHRVAIEIDGSDADGMWSVVVKGDAEVVEDEAVLAWADEGGPKPYVAEGKDVVVRIGIGRITGRKLVRPV